MGKALLILILGTLLCSQVQGQVFINATGTQCGGTGGLCSTAGFLNVSNSNVCVDGQWPGYSCVSPMVCTRASTLLWRCLTLSPPSPPSPNIPPAPPAQASPPPAVCTSPVSSLSGLIDPNTPSTECSKVVNNGPCSSTRSGSTNMVLVFSDEFSDLGRNMAAAGRHRTWTAADQWWDQDQDLSAYKPDMVTTRACTSGESCLSAGVLAIKVSPNTTTDAFSPQTSGPVAAGSKAYRSGMLSSWNKFCFTGGYMEARIKMPGNSTTGGLWPGLWLMGNLGRPGFQNSTLGMWPYSFNVCRSDNPSWNQPFDNKIGLTTNLCSLSGSSPPYDFRAGTARSVPQINVMRVKVVPANQTNQPDMYTNSGLMMAPLLPAGYSYLDGERLVGQCIDSSVSSASYTTNQCLRVRDGTANGGPGLCTCPAKPNGLQSSCWTGQSSTTSRVGNLDADQVSASVSLDSTAFSGFRTYGVWWKPATSQTANDGFIRFYIDGTPFYEVNSAALAAITFNNTLISPQRSIPYEPMQIVMNLGVSSFWGGVDSSLSSMLPAELLVDYIRVYQEQSLASTNTLSCSPTNYPTAQYIACNPTKFVLCNTSAPLTSCTDFQILREQVGNCRYTSTNPQPPPPPPPSPPAPASTTTISNIGQQCGGNLGGCLPSSRPQGSQYFGVCKDAALWDGWSCGSGALCSAGRDDTPQLMYCKLSTSAGTGAVRLNLGAPNGSSDVTTRGGLVFSSTWQSFVTPTTVATNSTTSIVAGSTVSTNPTINDTGLWNTWIESTSFIINLSTATNFTAGAQYLATLMFIEPWWTSTGQRIMSITYNSETVFSNMDLNTECGGPLAACIKRFVFTVPTSTQVIIGVFATSASKFPAVMSAVEVVRYTSPPPSPRPPRPPPPSPPATPPTSPYQSPAPSPPFQRTQPPSQSILLWYTATYLIDRTLSQSDSSITTLLSLLPSGSSATINGYTAYFSVALINSTCPSDVTPYRTIAAKQLSVDITSITATCNLAFFPPSPPPPSPPFSPPPPTIIPIGRKLRTPSAATTNTVGAVLSAARRFLTTATAVLTLPNWALPYLVAGDSTAAKADSVNDRLTVEGNGGRRRLQQTNVLVYTTTAGLTSVDMVASAPALVCAGYNNSCVTSFTSGTGTLQGTQITVVSYTTSTVGSTTSAACTAAGNIIANAINQVYSSFSPEAIGSPKCQPYLPPSPPLPGESSGYNDGSGGSSIDVKTVGLAVGVSVGGVLVLIALVLILRWAFKRDDTLIQEEFKPLNTPMALEALQNATGNGTGGTAITRTANFIPRTRAGVVSMGEDKPSLMQRLMGKKNASSASASVPDSPGLDVSKFANPHDEARKGMKGTITSIPQKTRGSKVRATEIIVTGVEPEKTFIGKAWSALTSRATSQATQATAGNFATLPGEPTPTGATQGILGAGKPGRPSRAGDPLLAPPEPKIKAGVTAQKLVPHTSNKGKLELTPTAKPDLEGADTSLLQPEAQPQSDAPQPQSDAPQPQSDAPQPQSDSLPPGQDLHLA